MNMNYLGAAEIDCDAPFRKGDELGWFEHGSTIIVFAPPGFRLCDDIREGTAIRMGRALMHLP
jgi:phosphatidylserine decarboxylase